MSDVIWTIFLGSLAGLLLFKETLFYVWLWQIKEYRWDRLKVFLVSPSGSKAYLFPNWYAVRGGFKRPRLTWRALAIGGAGLGFSWAGAGFFYLSFLGFSFSLPGVIAAWFLAGFLVPLGVTLGVILTTPFVKFQYQRIIKKAVRKRAGFKKLKVVGISGSYGKSSVKEMLFQILKLQFKTLKTPANINTEIGIAHLILGRLDSSFRLLVAELGAYRKAEIKATARIVQPQIGILTGLNQQHLALFGDFKTIKAAKFELIESLPSGGTAIFNLDDANVADLYQRARGDLKKIGYGLQKSPRVQVRAENVKLKKQGSSFELQSPWGKIQISLPLLGRANILNFLAAAACALEFGVDLKKIKQAALRLEAPAGTLKLVNLEPDFAVIDDSYNANPTGVKAALETLDAFQGFKRVVFLPSLIELGKASAEIHQSLGQDLAKQADWVFLTDKDAASAVKKGFGRVKNSQAQLKIALAEAQIFQTLAKLKKQGKLVILLAGRIPASLKELIFRL
jgi:UDP-N-acetylmuramoyl-tripeptide--D-alanyl-D-alanine ligase